MISTLPEIHRGCPDFRLARAWCSWSQQEKLNMRAVLSATVVIITAAVSAVPSAVFAHEAPAAAHKLPMVAGQVTKIDEAAQKVTIQHGPIPNLDMQGMTMVFRATDAEMLKGVKAGDKVRFMAEKINGQISVVRLEKAK
jgi:Cu(I)/Ag(I) efflux system periplasmic protein CusF